MKKTTKLPVPTAGKSTLPLMAAGSILESVPSVIDSISSIVESRTHSDPQMF